MRAYVWRNGKQIAIRTGRSLWWARRPGELGSSRGVADAQTGGALGGLD